MPESELWITRIFNDYLAGAGNAALRLVGNARRRRAPGPILSSCRFVVVVLLMAVFAMLRPRLSADRPGKLQHIFELIYEFVKGQAEDQVGHARAPLPGLFRHHLSVYSDLQPDRPDSVLRIADHERVGDGRLRICDILLLQPDGLDAQRPCATWRISPDPSGGSRRSCSPSRSSATWRACSRSPFVFMPTCSPANR